MTAKSDPLKDAIAYLEARGLTIEDASHLGLEVLEEQETAALSSSFQQREAIRIPYWMPDGSPMEDWPGCGQYYRIRYLGKATDVASLTGARREMRYCQPKDTVTCAYYPRLIDWADIAKDPESALLITEGEIKSAVACKFGFPCIGIGGVDAWRVSRVGLSWLPSLDLVDWKRRNVYIAYDSDVSRKPEVARALRQISEALQDRGAFPFLVYLPDIPGYDKVGLDDFIVQAGAAALEKTLAMAEPLGFAKPLWELNDRYVYVRDPGLVYSPNTRTRVSPSAFKEHLESTRRYQEQIIGADGGLKRRPISASAAWIAWPCRREVERLAYAPGEPLFTECGEVNTWPGWGCESVEGDVSLFLQLIDHLFHGAEPGVKEWFLRWCAYPVQHPGTKLYTAVVIWGPGTGTGKSLVGYTLGKVYGENFTEISHRDLDASFNSWVEGKQFVMGDDVAGSESRRKDADYLKKLITQSQVRINAKYTPEFTLRDVVNYYFTSNHPDAIFIEDDDRRYLVHEVTVRALPDEFYRRYDAWYKTPEAASALRYYLEHLDLGDFNPNARAPRTMARDRMMVNGQSDIAAWVRGLLSDPDGYLKVGGLPMESDLYTSAQLLALYAGGNGNRGVTAGGVGRELARCGIRQVCNGAPIRVPGQPRARYYAVRNIERWAEAPMEEVSEHLRTSGGAKF